MGYKIRKKHGLYAKHGQQSMENDRNKFIKNNFNNKTIRQRKANAE